MITRRTPFNDLPEYLSVAELASHLGLSRTMAYDYARQHGVRFGRLLRVPKVSLPAIPRSSLSSARLTENDAQSRDAAARENAIQLLVNVAIPALLRGFAKACADAARVLDR
jgi:hypothetical protein